MARFLLSGAHIALTARSPMCSRAWDIVIPRDFASDKTRFSGPRLSREQPVAEGAL
jgi:hypothetical protein